MGDKTFKTHNQQLRILRARGLTVPTGSPKRILENDNYYNVINGYKELFIASPGTTTTTEIYTPGTKFSEVAALYNFDNELKSIFLKRILRVENHIKSQLAYVFSERYGHDNYMKLNNFQFTPGNTKSIQEVVSLIKTTQEVIARQMNKHQAIRHYMLNYGYVPLWVLVGVLTLGTVSTFYGHMKQKDKQDVSRSFGIMDDELEKILGILTLCRNKCAHDERTYDFTTKEQIKTNSIHTRLGIPMRGGNPIYGKRDLFAVLISIKLLLKDKKDFKKMITEIRYIIKLLGGNLRTITINDVFQKMGFPNNWENLKNY